jgi:hypothetical protein
VAEKPRVWSEKRIANVGQFINYDPAPDGKRIGNHAGGNTGSPICAEPRDFRAEFLPRAAPTRSSG